jgi:N-acetylglucosaminyl-diphospho-decaprenol L-rhamnosyltransferase
VPRVSALVVSYNTRALLLESLASLDQDHVEMVVVDNASADGSADAVEQRYPSVRLFRSATNVGFAAAVNLAACRSSGEHLLLLNPDATLQRGALDALEQFLDDHPRAAAVGAALVYADGRAQDSAFRFPGLAQIALDLFPIPRLAGSRVNGRVRAGDRPVRIHHPLGACMLIRRDAWQAVGPFDEGYFMYVEEVDWCRRALATGWEVWHHPGAIAVHRGGQSTRQQADAMFAQLWRSRLRYYERFHSVGYNRIVHALVRLGMRAHARQARAKGLGQARLSAIDTVRALVE